MTTQPPSRALASAWCKFFRAIEHLDALSGEISTFMTPDVYHLEVDTEEISSDGDTHRIVLRRRVFFSREPDALRWGVLVGDVVVNLRAALDHLIYAISVSRDPKRFTKASTTEFPITDHVDAFAAMRTREQGSADPLRGLPASAVAVVQALQPYHRRNGDDVRADPLWLLREMSNIDKHRNVHMTTWCAYQVEWDITQLFEGTRIHRQWMHPLGPLSSGDVIAEIELSHGKYGEPTMLMDRHISFTVTLDEDDLRRDNTPLPYVLEELAGYVEAILSSLERFVLNA